MNQQLQQALGLTAKVKALVSEVTSSHIGRDDIVNAVWLSLISGHPAFFLGPFGVDKTGTVGAIVKRVNGAIFYDALMTTVGTPEEMLVASTSIEETPLPSGGRKIATSDELGLAAAAHVVFADEMFKAEERVLNALIDLAKGDGVRHGGQMVATPLMSFLAASNELPDAEGNLGAVWSRMTIRVQVRPLEAAGKKILVAARIKRDRANGKASASAQMTLAEVEALRKARPFVDVPDDVVYTTLEILQELVNDTSSDFHWAWDDDRRFGRLFDVMQANALLDGRAIVTKQDLRVLEWLLWDTPEQQAIVRAKVAPYARTPLDDAQETVDSLLAPGGTVAIVLGGNRAKGVEALTQCESAGKEIARLEGAATDTAMKQAIGALRQQVEKAKLDVIAVVTGAKRS